MQSDRTSVLFGACKVPPKQMQTSAKKQEQTSDHPQSRPSGHKPALLPHSGSAARMHAASRSLAEEPPSLVRRQQRAPVPKTVEAPRKDTKKRGQELHTERERGSLPQEERAVMPYYDDAGFGDDVPYDAVADTSSAAASNKPMPYAAEPAERELVHDTWRRPGPVAMKAPLEIPVVGSMATQLEATRAQLKRAVGGKLVDPVEEDADAEAPEAQPASTFTQGLADTWRAASQVSLTSRATGSAYHSTQEEDQWAAAADPAAAAASKKPPRAPASPAASVACTRRGRRKRSAAEMESEDEEDAYLSKLAVAEHSGSEDPSGSSLEENDVVAA